MESILPMGGFQMPFQRRLSRLYNDTKKSSDFVKEPVQTEEDPEIKALHRKLRIQKDRLVSWGLEWSDPNQSAEIDESLSKAGLSEVVGSIMSTIKDTLAEAEPLWLSSKHLVDSSRPTGDKKTPLVKWDKGRFEDLVRDLTSSIDTLIDVSRTRSSILPRRTSKSTIKSPTTEDFRPFERTRLITPQQIDYQGLTHVKSADPTSHPSRSVVYMSKTAYSELSQTTGVRQPWAPLLLEYANFNSIFSATGITPPMDRFEKLSTALQQEPQRSPGSWTGLPRLLGFFEDFDNSRIGLVYRFPASFDAVPLSGDKPAVAPLYRLPSLKDILCQPDSEPPMETKFRLAHNLANTIFDLHARGLTHGDITESNISFCVASSEGTDRQAGQVDLRRPLLSSFDIFSEHSEPQASSIRRHPLDPRCIQSSPLSKATDERVLELYSLAMVLLSIGLWTRLENLVPADLTAPIPESLLNHLSVRCGTLYMKAVQACWAAVDEEISGRSSGEDLLSSVQVKASRYLEACCILDGVSALEDKVSQELRGPAPATQQPPAKQSGSSHGIKDVKDPALFRPDETLGSRNTVATHKLHPEANSSLPSDNPATVVSKPEVKMKLYPHVPLAPDVVEKWNTTFMPQINHALRGFYKKHPESVEISLESVGPSPLATQPTVLVVCTSVGKVRAILKKRLGDLFEGPSGIALKVCRGQVLRSRRQSKAIMRSMAYRSQKTRAHSVASDEQGSEADAVNPEYQQKPGNGASIGAWIGDRHLPPVSFGGLIMVDNKAYGMTVHHMLDDPDRDFGPADANRSMATAGFEWSMESDVNTGSEDDDHGFELSDSESETYSETDITSEYDEDEDSEAEFDEPGDVPGIEPGCGEGYVVTQPALDDVEEGFFPSIETEDEDHLDTFSLGEVYASSGIRRKNANGLVHEVDWALFQFDEARQPSDNNMPQAEARGGSPTEKTQYDRLRPTAVAPFDSLPGTKVQCVARTSGLQTGTILPALTSVKIYGRATPSHTYQIASIPNDDCEGSSPPAFPMGIPGDSGAWIVGRNTGDLCGHVLAWSQRKHVAYICPMDILLRDIAETLEASEVGLPGGQLLINARGKAEEAYRPEKDPRDQLAEELDKLSHELSDEEPEDAPSATQRSFESPRLSVQTQRNASAQSLTSLSSRGSPISGLSGSMSFGVQSGRGIGVSV
ncbi:het-s domain protein [Sarocladium implicatum]|nr:het-s domain protein [Sarocladium implicatum]